MLKRLGPALLITTVLASIVVSAQQGRGTNPAAPAQQGRGANQNPDAEIPRRSSH